MITAAASGGLREREEFARRYAPVVRAYLATRWRGSPLSGETEDALQEVFVECFKDGGVLQTVESRCREGFRIYLLGVARNVARTAETQRDKQRSVSAGRVSAFADQAVDDATPSRAFDRAWAQTVMREAAEILEEQAREEGPDAMRRVALLTLHFHEQLPVREIARLWDAEPQRVHVEYARARREFKRALLTVLAAHNAGAPKALEQEWALLREALS